MAGKEEITSLVDCYDQAFLAPKSMIQAVKEACRQQGVKVPETPGQLAAVIYKSLAACYGATVKELESRMQCTFDRLYIVGGGSKDGFLNQLTANATGLLVQAGVTEATAVGNIMVQMLKAGEWQSLSEARAAVFASFAVKSYYP
jgi:rhamnulokinase